MQRKYNVVINKSINEDTIPYKVVEGITLPRLVDLRKTASPIEDQGALGSCTGNGIAGIIEYLENKSKWGESVEGNNFFRISRLFTYYNERVMEGTVNEDSGAQISDGIKSGVIYGYASESLWPYDITKFTEKPPAAAYLDARNHKITSYSKIISQSDMLNCLASGYPFVCGIEVYESFESAAVASTGHVPMPEANEQLLGGHCVGCFGYDMSKDLFIMRNSWGTKWGDAGWFFLPFNYIAKYGSDSWKVTN